MENNFFEIVSDSNAEITTEIRSFYDIHIIPHFYRLNNILYNNETKIDYNNFYDSLLLKVSCGTTACNPKEVYCLLASLLNKADVLYLGFSSKLSSSFSLVQTIIMELKEQSIKKRILSVDTLTGSLAQGLLVIQAAQRRQRGYSISEVYNYVLELVPHAKTFFIVKDIDCLINGGRIEYAKKESNAVSFVYEIDTTGKLRKVKTLIGSAFGYHKFAEYVRDRFLNSDFSHNTLGITHACIPQQMEKLKFALSEVLRCEKFIVKEMSPSLGAHFGVNSMSVSFLTKYY